MAKKSKIKKLTDEQYYTYIMGLKQGTAALFDSDGDVVVPEAFEKRNESADTENN